MNSLEPKKTLLFRILQVLEEHSDEQHPLTQAEIIDLLREGYGIDCERKAVHRNVSILRDDLDIDIVETKKGAYINERQFDRAELRLMIDSVLSSRHINAQHTAGLLKKLTTLGGKYFKSHTKHLYNFGEWQKSTNMDFFLNVEVLDEAIEKEVQVRFYYNKYGIDKKLHPTSENKHVVSPYQLILHKQHYYLIAKMLQHDSITFFRLDKITGIEPTDQPIQPVKSVTGYRSGLRLAEIATTLPYLFTDKPERVDIKCPNWMADELIDWFGFDFSLKPVDKEHFVANIKVSPKAMVYWVMQYSENVEVLAPPAVRDEVIAKIKKLNTIYNVKP